MVTALYSQRFRQIQIKEKRSEGSNRPGTKRIASEDGANPAIRGRSRRNAGEQQDPWSTSSLCRRRSRSSRCDAAPIQGGPDHIDSQGARTSGCERRRIQTHVRRTLRPLNRILQRERRQHAHLQYGARDARRERYRRWRPTHCYGCGLLKSASRHRQCHRIFFWRWCFQ